MIFVTTFTAVMRARLDRGEDGFFVRIFFGGAGGAGWLGGFLGGFDDRGVVGGFVVSKFMFVSELGMFEIDDAVAFHFFSVGGVFFEDVAAAGGHGV